MSQAYSAEHVWIAATNVVLATNLAKQAVRRGTVRVPADTKVDVLEVYCQHCRRPYDAVGDQPCEAAGNRDHLIGGPTGERKKRKHPYHECEEYGCTLGKPAAADIGTGTGG